VNSITVLIYWFVIVIGLSNGDYTMEDDEYFDADAVVLDANVSDLILDAANRRGMTFEEFTLFLFDNAANEEYAIQQCEDAKSDKHIH
jgi:hypothetical protein